jgi:hypothetical protein
MKGFHNCFKSPLFCFHGNYGKVCPTDSDFFGLSRSTRCGCGSYHASSISVRRVTCYDHFCGFQFFSILAVSMATAKKIGIGWTNFAVVAMETKKGGFKTIVESFHQTS